NSATKLSVAMGKPSNVSAIRLSITEAIHGKPSVTKRSGVKAIRTNGLETRPSTIAATLGNTSAIKRLDQMEQAARDLGTKLFANRYVDSRAARRHNRAGQLDVNPYNDYSFPSNTLAKLVDTDGDYDAYNVQLHAVETCSCCRGTYFSTGHMLRY